MHISINRATQDARLQDLVKEEITGPGLAPLSSKHLVEGPVKVLEGGHLSPQVSGSLHGTFKKGRPGRLRQDVYHRPGRQVIFGPSPVSRLPGATKADIVVLVVGVVVVAIGHAQIVRVVVLPAPKQAAQLVQSTGKVLILTEAVELQVPAQTVVSLQPLQVKVRVLEGLSPATDLCRCLVPAYFPICIPV